MDCLQRQGIVGLLLLVLVLSCAALSPAYAAPHLECQITYAGTTETVVATPIENPYTAAAVDIAGRFRFKPVLVGQGAQLRYLSIYVYLQTERQSILIQQAKYLPPYSLPVPDGRIALTGEQRLYAGPAQRELIYQCTLLGVAP